MMLRDSEPFPFIRRLDRDVWSSSSLEIAEQTFLMMTTCPMPPSPMRDERWAINLRLQRPLVIPLSSKEPANFGSIWPFPEHHAEIDVDAEGWSKFFGSW